MTRRTTAALLCGVALACGGLTACGGEGSRGESTASSPSITHRAVTDPEKTYTIDVSSAWSAAAPPGEGIEAWAVAAPIDGFAANVNVLTQNAPGLDLQGYLDASLANMGTAKVVSSKLVTAGSRRLGLLEYTQTMPAGGKERPLHFLATFDVAGGRAVVATFTAEESSFASLRAAVEPFLLTLRAT